MSLYQSFKHRLRSYKIVFSISYNKLMLQNIIKYFKTEDSFFTKINVLLILSLLFFSDNTLKNFIAPTFIAIIFAKFIYKIIKKLQSNQPNKILLDIKKILIKKKSENSYISHLLDKNISINNVEHSLSFNQKDITKIIRNNIYYKLQNQNILNNNLINLLFYNQLYNNYLYNNYAIFLIKNINFLNFTTTLYSSKNYFCYKKENLQLQKEKLISNEDNIIENNNILNEVYDLIFANNLDKKLAKLYIEEKIKFVTKSTLDKKLAEKIFCENFLLNINKHKSNVLLTEFHNNFKNNQHNIYNEFLKYF